MDEKLESKYQVFLLSTNELTRDWKRKCFQSLRKETALGNQPIAVPFPHFPGRQNTGVISSDFQITYAKYTPTE